jgi:hypothetical protein
MSITTTRQTSDAVAIDAGSLVDIDGTSYYAVRNVDEMHPFLMSITSDGDRWMFLSSGGGLTAGRENASNALFPYETDDRLHALSGVNGSVTAMRLIDRDPDNIWRPMIGKTGATRQRTLLKSVTGDSAIFEEADAGTGLTFRYRWASGARFGFIRTAMLTNEGDEPIAVEIVDGIRSILPYGLDPTVHLHMGNLTNAYKRSEVIDRDARLATYSLESLVTDQTEPAQALRATVAWSYGLGDNAVSLRPDAVRLLESGSDVSDANLVTGMPGAYFLTGRVEIEPGKTKTWYIVADVGLDQPAVAALGHSLRALTNPPASL